MQRSETMYQGKIPVFDLHCDTLDRLALRRSNVYPDFNRLNEEEGVSLSRMTSLYDNDAHISLARVRPYAWCQCFAIFVPDVLQGEEAWRLYTKVKSFYDKQCEVNARDIMSVSHPSKIPTAFAVEKCAALLTVEGASFFTDSLAPLDVLEKDGVQMITITWNGPNALASGKQTHAGFSSFGREVVKGLENRRIIVDVSHLNDESFQELLEFSKRPFVASHSNSRAVCDHPRNLTDDQFLAIADRGGIVGMNYCNDFLVSGKNEADPDDILRHINHWLELGGEASIALGSDYDGCDIPSWLRPADRIGTLYESVARAFGKDNANRFFFENAYDFFLENRKEYPGHS